MPIVYILYNVILYIYMYMSLSLSFSHEILPLILCHTLLCYVVQSWVLERLVRESKLQDPWVWAPESGHFTFMAGWPNFLFEDIQSLDVMLSPSALKQKQALGLWCSALGFGFDH